jgi:hypothetical protein
MAYRIQRNRSASVIAAAILAGSIGSARAVVVDVSGTLDSGYDVSSQADITFGAGSMHIDLTNFFVEALVAAPQLLTGISFLIDGLAASPTASIGDGIGTLVNIAPGDPTPASATWNLTVLPGSFAISALNAQPDFGVIPDPSPPDALPVCPAQGGGSLCTGSHNPYFLGSVGFDIDNLVGVTAGSRISNVVFQYGTDAGKDTLSACLREPCEEHTVSTPSTPALLFAGLAAIGICARRRKSN